MFHDINDIPSCSRKVLQFVGAKQCLQQMTELVEQCFDL